MQHDLVLDAVTAWAETDANVRALVLEGSAARGDGSVDEWSDLDIRVYATDPSPLLEERAWFEQFGDVLVIEALENPGRVPTRLVYYVDGKIDFTIAPASALQGKASFGPPVRVLVDKDDIAAPIAAGSRPQVRPPDAHEFDVCINEFYAAALMLARMIVRDEPLKAKLRDFDLKRRLFEMITWDHAARDGDARDVRPLGTDFRRWADPDVVRGLDRCWSDLSPQSMTAALGASIELFVDTANRAAATLELPRFDHAAVGREINRILARAE